MKEWLTIFAIAFSVLSLAFSVGLVIKQNMIIERLRNAYKNINEIEWALGPEVKKKVLVKREKDKRDKCAENAE